MKYLIRTENSDPHNTEKFYFTQSENLDSCWTKDRKLATVFDDYLSAEIVRDDLFEGEVHAYPGNILDRIMWLISVIYICFILIPLFLLFHTMAALLGILANFTIYNFTRITLPDELLSKIGTGTMSYGFLKIMISIIQPLYQSFYELKSNLKSIKFL